EYSILCKLIRRKLKDDFENFQKEKLLKTAESRKTCKRELTQYRLNRERRKARRYNFTETIHRLPRNGYEQDQLEEWCQHKQREIISTQICRRHCTNCRKHQPTAEHA
ncbi:hypothetical protein G0U57_000804, partial [Chelydra serpentina]